MKTAVAYIRVSTEMQTEYSPDSQRKLIKEYADKHDLLLTDFYNDEGITGTKVDMRPAFKRMIADAKKKLFDVILIYHSSRFARNHEESTIYRAMLNREGIEVISITQPSIDYKTDLMMNAIYAVMDERYSIDLSENVKRGMKEKASRGIYISCAPLGYTRAEHKKPLVINEAESAIIRWIFNEYEHGNTMFAISKELNAKGNKGKRGNDFDRRGIYRILSNPIYKGYFSWTCDDETIYMRADHDSIISEEQFDKVQAMIAENRHRRNYKSRDAYICSHWLTGILRCPVCGTTYVFIKGYEGRSNRFRCGRYSNASCTNKHSITVSAIERIVITYLTKTPFEKLKFTKPVNNHETLDGDFHETLAKLERGLDRAKDAYLQGIDTIDEYKKNKSVITKDIENIKAYLNDKKAPAVNREKVENRIRDLIAMLMSANDNKTKNTMVRAVISKIIMNQNVDEIDFIFYS